MELREEGDVSPEALAAVDATRRFVGPGENLVVDSSIGWIYALAGKETEAREIVELWKGLAEQRYVDPFYIAWIHAALGDRELALDLLEKGYEERSPSMVFIKINDFFGLDSDPRYQDLRRRVGFPP